VAKQLIDQNINIYLDSAKSYGKEILKSLMDNHKKEVNGVYLKPVYSQYSDDNDSAVIVPGHTSFLFADLLERLRYLIKNSKLFVIPHTSNIVNAAQFFTLWSLEYLYYGHHKPIILIGKEWHSTIEKLSEVFKLNEFETHPIIICETEAEVYSNLEKLDDNYDEVF
jgi:hypothetical protein